MPMTKLLLNLEEYYLLTELCKESTEMRLQEKDHQFFILFTHEKGQTLFDLLSDELQEYGFNADDTHNWRGRVLQNLLSRMRNMGY